MAFQAVLDFEFCTQQALSILHLQKRRYMTYLASLFPVLSDDIFATPLPYQWQDNSQFSLHCPVAFALSCNLFSIPGDIFLSPTVYNTTAISPLPAQTSLPRRSSTTSIPMPPHHLPVRCTCLLLHRQAQTGRKPLSLWQALHILSIHSIFSSLAVVSTLLLQTVSPISPPVTAGSACGEHVLSELQQLPSSGGIRTKALDHDSCYIYCLPLLSLSPPVLTNHTLSLHSPAPLPVRCTQTGVCRHTFWDNSTTVSLVL